MAADLFPTIARIVGGKLVTIGVGHDCHSKLHLCHSNFPAGTQGLLHWNPIPSGRNICSEQPSGERTRTCSAFARLPPPATAFPSPKPCVRMDSWKNICCLFEHEKRNQKKCQIQKLAKWKIRPMHSKSCSGFGLIEKQQPAGGLSVWLAETKDISPTCLRVVSWAPGLLGFEARSLLVLEMLSSRRPFHGEAKRRRLESSRETNPSSTSTAFEPCNAQHEGKREIGTFGRSEKL